MDFRPAKSGASFVAAIGTRVLGIDTSLRSTGFGVIEAQGSRLTSVEHGVIRIPAAAPHSQCLLRLQTGLREVLERARPSSVAIEGIFYCKNVKTAVTLGEARGVAIVACAALGVPVFEYAPRRVKQAVVGHGGAGKEQVLQMVMRLLSLREEPPEDAADALALAICHTHSRSSCALLMPKES